MITKVGFLAMLLILGLACTADQRNKKTHPNNQIRSIILLEKWILDHIMMERMVNTIALVWRRYRLHLQGRKNLFMLSRPGSEYGSLCWYCVGTQGFHSEQYGTIMLGRETHAEPGIFLCYFCNFCYCYSTRILQ